ncbi:MAG TPA: hypothetical protein PKD26_04305 [Pyrinomonadaceae bacterium]|nr:hypothetical protein [Pyrinomonadaceae bacterium]
MNSYATIAENPTPANTAGVDQSRATVVAGEIFDLKVVGRGDDRWIFGYEFPGCIEVEGRGYAGAVNDLLHQSPVTVVKIPAENCRGRPLGNTN